MKVKSLADLKRAIATPGVSIRVLEHWQPQLKNTTRTPKATRNGGRKGIQGNGYWFDAPGRDGKIAEMWAEIPKASELRFNADGTVTFYPNVPGHSWTLAFEEAA